MIHFSSFFLYHDGIIGLKQFSSKGLKEIKVVDGPKIDVFRPDRTPDADASQELIHRII